MDSITLAVISEKTSLSKSLDRLRRGTRGVVVRSKERSPLLWTVADLLQAENDALDAGIDPNSISLGMITPVRQPIIAPGHVHLTPKAQSYGFMLGEGRPIDLVRYEELFAQTDNRYAIHEITDKTAVVVTASEFAANLTGALIICGCDGSPTHRFERWQIINFPACNKAHAATVTCATVSDVS